MKVLLEKLVNIQHCETKTTIRPFLGRSTFQWAPGKYYDPTSNLR